MQPDLTVFRRRLEDGLAQAAQTLAQAHASAGTVTLDQSSVGRLSRMDAIQQQAMANNMVERLESRRRQLEAALDRIDAGTFGLCCACESDLDPDRLENDPAVVFCKACLMQRDKHGNSPDGR